MCHDVNSGYLEELRGEWQLTSPLKKEILHSRFCCEACGASSGRALTHRHILIRWSVTCTLHLTRFLTRSFLAVPSCWPTVLLPLPYEVLQTRRLNSIHLLSVFLFKVLLFHSLEYPLPHHLIIKLFTSTGTEWSETEAWRRTLLELSMLKFYSCPKYWIQCESRLNGLHLACSFLLRVTVMWRSVNRRISLNSPS